MLQILVLYLVFVSIKNGPHTRKVSLCLFLQMSRSFHLTEHSVCNFVFISRVISDFVLGGQLTTSVVCYGRKEVLHKNEQKTIRFYRINVCTVLVRAWNTIDILLSKY